MSALFVALVAFTATACEEASDTSGSALSPAPPAARTSTRLARIDWLDAQEGASPERWLASREAGQDVPDNDDSVIAMRKSLQIAHDRYRDPTRMIANRAVQLEGMLKSVGIEEPASRLIVGLSEIAEKGPRLEGFGAACEHYFNLRKQGMSREAAIQRLKDGRG